MNCIWVISAFLPLSVAQYQTCGAGQYLPATGGVCTAWCFVTLMLFFYCMCSPSGTYKSAPINALVNYDFTAPLLGHICAIQVSLCLMYNILKLLGRLDV